MRQRKPLFLLLCLPLAASCFHELDTGATVGTIPPPANEPPPGPTVAIATPPIELPEGHPAGKESEDSCVLTRFQAQQIRATYCAGCHGGGSPGASRGQPAFDFVMDDAKLMNATSASVRDPRDPMKGMRFLIPGDPENSRLYFRVSHGEMPPTAPLGVKPIPAPTISDISVLREWILSCMGVKPGVPGNPGEIPPPGGEGGSVVPPNPTTPPETPPTQPPPPVRPPPGMTPPVVPPPTVMPPPTIPPPVLGLDPMKFYRLKSQTSSLCLDTAGQAQGGFNGRNNLVQDTCATVNTQQWRFTPQQGGDFEISNRSTGLCLADRGQVVGQLSCQSTQNIRWTVTQAAAGALRIAEAGQAGRCLRSPSATVGSQVLRAACGDAVGDQVWIAEELTP